MPGLVPGLLFVVERVAHAKWHARGMRTGGAMCARSGGVSTASPGPEPEAAEDDER